MRKSIIIGLISLIVTVVAFIFAFIVFEKGKQTIKGEKVQEFFLWVFLISSSVFSICFIINIPYFWSLFKEFLAHIFH